jgi:VWFA-related protein
VDKKISPVVFLPFFCLLLIFFAPGKAGEAQDQQHQAVAINIEVPVRVFQGETFVDTLKIDDFELYEDGVLQKIEAVYLIQKKDIQREESEMPTDMAREIFSPQLSRHFVLVFEIIDYLPRVGEAIDLFFKQVIMPGDSLAVVTPLKTYNIKAGALQNLPREAIARQLKDKLRKDTLLASAEYKKILKEIESLYMRSGNYVDETSDWKTVIRDLLSQLENLRVVDEKKLLAFSEYLQDMSGQKNVFMFFQKEMLPKYNEVEMSIEVAKNSPENPAKFFDAFDITHFYRRDITFDVDKIKRIFSDSSIQIHFLFLTEKPQTELAVERMRPLSSANVVYQEQSEDIFKAFNQVSAATGGYASSAANASAAFSKAVEASETYYLLYYSPKKYTEDGKFHNLRIRVKGRNYRITHRSGYLAD